MTKLLTLAFVFCFWGTGAVSDPVPVLINEQSKRSRLVFEFEKRPEWEIQRNGRGYLIEFSETNIHGFDLNQVFQSGNRRRVADIRVPDSWSIEFDLACDCSVRVMNGANERLFVEIIENENTVEIADARATGRSAPLEQGANVTRMADGDMTHRTPDQFALPTFDLNEFSQPASQLLDLSLPAGQVRGTLFEPEHSIAIELLGQTFSRAVSQGLIESNTSAAPTLGATITDALRSHSGRSNVTAATGFDPAELPETLAVPPTVVGTICIPDSYVDVPSWNGFEENVVLGKLRSMAVAEDGSLTANGAFQLARYYLWAGFGAEASQFARFIDDEKHRQLVEALSEIMDHGSTRSSVLAGQLHCKGTIALWGALAANFSADDAPESTNHILAAFSALPPHLRSHLGPKLSERLQMAGLNGAARTALNAVTRSGKQTDKSTLATAKLDLSGTQADDARRVLSDLSNGTDTTSAKAMLALFRDAEDRGMPPNPSWVEDAYSLVGALEGIEIAEELNVARLRGQVALDQMDEFRASLAERGPGLTENVQRELASHALARSVEQSDDATFVRTELGLRRIVDLTLFANDERAALATRLFDLGLPSRAEAYLSDKPSNKDELLTAFRILHALGKTDRALLLVNNTDVAGQPSVLAEALVSAERPQDSIGIFATMGDETSAVEMALRTGSWDWLQSNGPEDLALAAGFLRQIPEFSTASQSPNGDLIDTSRALRENIDVLLNSTVEAGN